MRYLLAVALLACSPAGPSAQPRGIVSQPTRSVPVNPTLPPDAFRVTVVTSRYGQVEATVVVDAVPSGDCVLGAVLPSGRASEAAELQSSGRKVGPGTTTLKWTYGRSGNTTPGQGKHTISCFSLEHRGSVDVSASFTVP